MGQTTLRGGCPDFLSGILQKICADATMVATVYLQGETMKKFCVFSGFLGAGKTTAMMALTKYCGNAAMISNDLGHGVELADDRLARLEGCRSSELTETCICYQNENLARRIDRCFQEGCELVISDIPGFGVGALEHVYHGLSEKYPGVYELAPFTVLVEPAAVALLRRGETGDMAYIYHAQLAEADLIVLNKCDAIEETERDDCLGWLGAQYPHARCIAISARTGWGMDELAAILRQGRASMRRPDIGYGGAEFAAAIGKLSEYYIQYYAQVCCSEFDGTDYLLHMAQQVKAALSGTGWEIPHLKLLAWEPEGDYGKVDLVGAKRPIEITRRFARPCTRIAVILNASGVCPGDRMRGIVTDAVEDASRAYQLEIMVFKEECFGMGD